MSSCYVMFQARICVICESRVVRAMWEVVLKAWAACAAMYSHAFHVSGSSSQPQHFRAAGDREEAVLDAEAVLAGERYSVDWRQCRTLRMQPPKI
eukprot:1226269-Amphidinium_carterae.3